MQAKTITLGGKQYELHPLTMRPARDFRQKISYELNGIIGEALQLGETELDNYAQLAGLAQRVSSAALGSVDTIAELLFEYSPELQNDRANIEAKAFDEEIIAAFMEALKQLFPFGSLAKSLTGLAAQAISTSSRSANGASGPTSSKRGS